MSASSSEASLKLAVAGKVFEAEITEIALSDGPALVAQTPATALSRAHLLGEQPQVLGCPKGYRAIPVLLSEPEKRDALPVRVPWTWELVRMKQGGAAV